MPQSFKSLGITEKTYLKLRGAQDKETHVDKMFRGKISRRESCMHQEQTEAQTMAERAPEVFGIH